MAETMAAIVMKLAPMYWHDAATYVGPRVGPRVGSHHTNASSQRPGERQHKAAHSCRARETVPQAEAARSNASAPHARPMRGARSQKVFSLPPLTHWLVWLVGFNNPLDPLDELRQQRLALILVLLRHVCSCRRRKEKEEQLRSSSCYSGQLRIRQVVDSDNSR
jgi:hypothetical protein